MATRKQKAAARRNIKKAQAANRRKGGKRSKSRRTVTKTGVKRLGRVKRSLARATRALKKAHALL